MPRYRENYPLDSQTVTDGDTGLLGVNARELPEYLPPGWCASAENIKFRHGAAETRGGLFTPVQWNHRLREVPLENCEAVLVSFQGDATAFYTATLTGPTAFVSGGTGEVTFYGDSLQGIGTMLNEVLIGTSIVYNYGTIQAQDLVIPVRIDEAGNPQVLNGAGEMVVVSIQCGLSDLYSGTAVLVSTLSTEDNDGITYIDPNTAPYYSGNSALQTPVLRDFTPTVSEAARESASDASVHPFIEVVYDSGSVRLRYAAGLPMVVTDGYAKPPEYITGAGVYADVYGAEWLLVATPQGVWRSREDRGPELISCVDVPGEDVTFTQLAGRVLMFRGEELAPLWWTGDRNSGFEYLPVTGLDDGTSTIPPMKRAETVASARIIGAYGSEDEVIFSDILEPDRYDPLVSIRIGGGSQGRVQRLWPLTEQTVVVFKERGIYILDGVVGNLAGITAQEVNARLGLVAPDAVAQIGSELFFLARHGVYRFTQVLEQRLSTSALAVSEPIAPLLERRVNWQAVATACAGVDGEYFVLALPVDGSELPNAILRYDTRREAWEGLWTFPAGVTVTKLVPLQWNGRLRLAAVDFRNGYVYLTDEQSGTDTIGREEVVIASSLTTRAYSAGDAGRKRFRRVGMTLETLSAVSTGATYSLSVAADGVAETQTVGPQPRTWIATRSHLSGKGTRDVTNANDDQGDPWWEDYGVYASQAALIKSGLAIDKEQAHTERATCNVKGRTLQVTLSCTSGSARVTHVGVEAVPEDRQPRAQE